MKKLISIVLAIVMVMAISVPAFATELNQENTSGTAKVVYKAGQTVDDNGTEDPSDDIVMGTYTVTIPAYIEVADVDGTPEEYDVIAENVLIPYQTSLYVNVEFSELELDGNTLAYDMQANPQSAGTLTSIASGDTILTVAAGDPTAVITSTIGAVLTEAPSYAGNFQDIATFTVSVK